MSVELGVFIFENISSGGETVVFPHEPMLPLTNLSNLISELKDLIQFPLPTILSCNLEQRNAEGGELEISIIIRGLFGASLVVPCSFPVSEYPE